MPHKTDNNNLTQILIDSRDAWDLKRQTSRKD